MPPSYTIKIIAGSLGHENSFTPPSSVALETVLGISINKNGHILFADGNKLRIINKTKHTIKTVDTHPDIRYPCGVSISKRGDVAVTDQVSCSLFRFNLKTPQDISTIELSSNATTNQSAHNTSVAVATKGNVVVCNHATDKIILASVSLQETLFPNQKHQQHKIQPRGIYFDSKTGKAICADVLGNQIVSIDPQNFGIEPIVQSESFCQPMAIALTREGHLIIADYGDRCIKLVHVSTKKVFTIAGTGEAGFQGDGGPALSAQLFAPYAVAVRKSDGCIFVADGPTVRILEPHQHNN